MRHIPIMMVAAALFAAAACGDDPASPADDEIWAKNSVFTPDDRTVHTGATVTWVNEDGITHNITSTNVPTGATGFAQNIPPNGGTFVLTPTLAGAYNYYCNIHGSPTAGMRGTLNVSVP